MKNYVRILVRIERRMVSELKKIKEEDLRSVNSLVNIAVLEFIERYRQKKK